MATIQGFKGLQYPKSTDPRLQQAWRNNNYQYATSSHQIDHDMHPGLIVCPNDEHDIIATVKYAKQNKLAIAVASGGHQYSGACSTSGNNILINLKNTFKDKQKDLLVLPDVPGQRFSAADSAHGAYVYTSVSWSLGDFNGFLKLNRLFVPHGQCTDVRVGGHAQTGKSTSDNASNRRLTSTTRRVRTARSIFRAARRPCQTHPSDQSRRRDQRHRPEL